MKPQVLFLPAALAALTLLGLYEGYQQSQQNVTRLSPQGCRMSWMSPSYILQSEFDELWSPLSRRYSLWLYREVEWDSTPHLHYHEGNPVLFIPGNAGSSRQARSIASSAARQFYSDPGERNPVFEGFRPLDVFTAEFNEDLSALHGSTLKTQAEYVSEAIAYILSTYRGSRPRITLIGHSMGGIVARAAMTLPAHSGWNVSDIAAIITMSAPNSLAPARMDSTMDSIYRDISHSENSRSEARVPTLAICGGSTDSLIPSESCVLRDLTLSSESPRFRRTIHTTALLGTWTGIGHREMVWCHQVRWRVARAALELGHSGDPTTVASMSFNHWFPPPTNEGIEPSDSGHARFTLKKPDFTVVTSRVLRVPNPPTSNHVYLVPLPRATSPSVFSLLLARGMLTNPRLPRHMRPFSENPLKVSLFHCTSAASPSVPDWSGCVPLSLSNSSSVLLPLPINEDPFPGKEGVDEPDTMLYFSAHVSPKYRDVSESEEWVAVQVLGSSETRGWLTFGFDQERDYRRVVSGPVVGSRTLEFNSRDSFIPFKTSVSVSMSSSALVVYQAHVQYSGSCSHSLVPSPVIHLTPGSVASSESHFFAPAPEQTLYLSSHTSGPFIHHAGPSSPSTFDIYSSGTCGIKTITLKIDWRASFGRMATRYWTSLAVYAAGVVALSLANAWSKWDSDTEAASDFLDPTSSLTLITKREIPIWGGILTALALLPLPRYALLGNGGDLLFAWLPSLCLALATGLVWMVWGTLLGLVSVLERLRKRFGGESQPSVPYSLTTKLLAGALFTLLTVLLFPYELFYAVILIRHIWRCSSPEGVSYSGRSIRKVRMSPPPSVRGLEGDVSLEEVGSKSSWSGMAPSPTLQGLGGYNRQSSLSTTIRAQQLHVLLLLNILFPLIGPVLAVWLRTILSSGLFTPFRDDHSVLRIIFLICLAESTDREIPRAKQKTLARLVSVSTLAVGAFSLVLGPRFSYGVALMANFNAAVMCTSIAATWWL